MSTHDQNTLSRRHLLRSAAAIPAAAGLLAAAGRFAPSVARAADPVRYGVSGPLSGTAAEYGRIWKKGFDLALEEINGAGGLQGRLIELKYEDSQADPKQSVPIAQKFVNDSSILAELGDFASPASMAASPIYERGKLVQFGFTNSHPDFTKGGEYMFSPSISQIQDATYLAQLAVERAGKKQAVLYRNTDWGKISSDIYVKELEARGGEAVLVDNYLETEKDFRTLLAKVRDANPESLTLIAYYNDGALIVQQAKDVGITVPIVAIGSCYSPQFIELGGDSTEGVLLATSFFPTDPRPEVQTFVTAYKTKYNETPDLFAAGAYDAVKIVAWATEKGGFTREGIREALDTGVDIPSIIHGPFTFNDERRVDEVKEVAIKVEGGQFVLA
ncbi:MAG: branched-chain amino acid transport system substrate-binding protein [Thermomicrobiales bacterium]|jgi:branched-chain amino acid transport system substrate-binding protein|nr:branched-chain amino acid transport system substrate-binding protein [Thermomicrobiales bacterium]